VDPLAGFFRGERRLPISSTLGSFLRIEEIATGTACRSI